MKQSISDVRPDGEQAAEKRVPPEKEARDAVKRGAYVACAVAAFQLIMALVATGSNSNALAERGIISGLWYAALAVWLLASSSRVAAVLLTISLVIFSLSMVLTQEHGAPWILLLVAGLCTIDCLIGAFKYHKLSHEAGSSPRGQEDGT